MTPQQKPSRANVVRQRRTSQLPKERVRERSKKTSFTRGIPKEGGKAGTRQTSRTSRQAYRPESVFLPVEPRPVTPTTLHRMKGGALRQTFGVSSPVSSKGRMTKNPHQKGYDFAFNLGRTAVRTPQVSLPSLGSRWVSAGLTLILIVLLYTMGTANSFKVAAIELTGNQRLDPAVVSTNLDLTGQPIFKAVPSQIEKELHSAFPDLARVSVNVIFPNHLRVAVVERTPILEWHQDGETKWIDANGFAFPRRGDVPGLVQISSSSNPPRPPVDSQKSPDGRPFIDPTMVQAILTLFPQVPGGAPMIYDSKYGMGWQDPRGWSVYFGQNIQQIEMKKQIYQAILDTFSQQGIKPTLVSVAYLDAPFYK
jgi:cell division protein FtsQ